jgi:hypothetical protein
MRRLLARRLDLWLPSYVAAAAERHRLRSWRARALTHVLFFVCDHFEPQHGVLSFDQGRQRVRRWHAGYKEFQDECFRQSGLRPVHTWFYPPHHGLEHLAPLAHMAFDGLGEVELHYHHENDTDESLRANLAGTLRDFNRAGLLLQSGEPPGRSFGFIHGNWALDNSAGGRFCGVNSELTILQELGCWGDLTMPSANECQTRKINSIYYALDNPAEPKSHNWGVDARAGAPPPRGLLMIQGPLALNFRAPSHPRIENASLTSSNWARPDRVRAWLDCHVHVRGRPEWLFIKLHTHGAIERDFDALFGEKARAMHRMFATNLNDNRRYKLHYVSARQAFNVIKAAEAGRDGDPADFYDYQIGRQATAYYCLDTPHELSCCVGDRLVVRDIEAARAATLRLRTPRLTITGPLRGCTVDRRTASVHLEVHPDSTHLPLEIDGSAPTRIEGGTVRSDGGGRLLVDSAASVRLQY